LENKKTAFIIAGPNGSGKTTFSISLIKNTTILTGTHLNADIVGKAYENDAEFSSLSPYDRHVKISEMVENTIDKLIEKGDNLILETVFSSKYKLDVFNKLKSAGYFVNVVFVATSDPIINIINVAQRYLKGGHEVAISKIFSRYKGSLENLTKISSSADCLILIDNSVIDQTPIVFAAISNGQKCYINDSSGDMPKWIGEVLDSIDKQFYSEDKIAVCNQIQCALDEQFMEFVAMDTDSMLNTLND